MPWVYPMVAFAAYTGAPGGRDAASATATDWTWRAGLSRSARRSGSRGSVPPAQLPITPRLGEALREWLAVRPESPFLFCQAQQVCRSKTKREAPTAVTPDEAHDHFKRTVAGSKWASLRGYHVLRHSFISALASEGVDQRVIDEIVGHQSEQQRKRYRHLYPKVMKEAIALGSSRVRCDNRLVVVDTDRGQDAVCFTRDTDGVHGGDAVHARPWKAEACRW